MIALSIIGVLSSVAVLSIIGVSSSIAVLPVIPALFSIAVLCSIAALYIITSPTSTLLLRQHKHHPVPPVRRLAQRLAQLFITLLHRRRSALPHHRTQQHYAPPPSTHDLHARRLAPARHPQNPTAHSPDLVVKPVLREHVPHVGEHPRHGLRCGPVPHVLHDAATVFYEQHDTHGNGKPLKWERFREQR